MEETITDVMGLINKTAIDISGKFYKDLDSAIKEAMVKDSSKPLGCRIEYFPGGGNFLNEKNEILITWKTPTVEIIEPKTAVGNRKYMVMYEIGDGKNDA